MTPYLIERGLYPPQIDARPSPLLGLVVVIPCHDEDFLLLSLLSLQKCERPPCDVEVIVVINESEDASKTVKEKNRATFEQVQRWAATTRPGWLRFHILHFDDVPRKHAGVGLARKIGMDEATYRFAKMGNPKGIIACFDADSRCERNYLQAIYAHFTENPKAQACGIHFEHPLSGPDFGDEIYEAITLYELHLRYYVLAQRWAGIPHAWQTIGSSMAVRCDAYQQQGGMNRRQAGEDFYFLHKFITLGGFGEIRATKVIPSPRPSHRVPFGTGRAVGELLKNGIQYMTYSPRSFEDLQAFFNENLYEVKDLDELYRRLPASIAEFLRLNGFEKKLAEIQLNTSNTESFQKRFWRWFDAFMVMKYVHFAREHYYNDMDIMEATKWLLNNMGINAAHVTPQHYLTLLRKY